MQQHVKLHFRIVDLGGDHVCTNRKNIRGFRCDRTSEGHRRKNLHEESRDRAYKGSPPRDYVGRHPPLQGESAFSPKPNESTFLAPFKIQKKPELPALKN